MTGLRYLQYPTARKYSISTITHCAHIIYVNISLCVYNEVTSDLLMAFIMC